MNRRPFASVVTALLAMTALLALLALMAWTNTDAPAPAQAAPLLAAPTVTEVDPSSAPNDLDTPIVITGTDFAVSATVQLGDVSLDDAGWVSSATLTATVPWGLDPGVYTLTVTNPGEGSDSRPNAFTVTQGIGVWNTTELYGGSVQQVAIHPFTPTMLYASTGAGLFRSYDGAENWSLKLGPVERNLAFDALSPRRVYGEGEPHGGGFLWRSDDAGDTWIPITTTFPVTQTSGRGCWVRHQIRVVSETLYVAACGADGGPSGLITSTDHGETWTPAMTGLTDTQVTALVFHPTDSLTVYLGTASGNVFISHDGGASWDFSSRPVSYVHDLGVNPFGAHEVWVSAGDMLGDPCGLYKSDDTELTAWTSIGEPASHEWCSAGVFFAPGTWGEVVSGTVFLASEGVLFKTTDGGDTSYPFGPEGWIHDIALHPTDPNIIFVGEGGWGDGFYKTTDSGASWQIANLGMTAIVPEIYTVPGQPDVVYALSLGKVYRGTQGGQVWQRLPVSGVQTILIDLITPTRLYAGAADGVFISQDGGQSWPTFVPITRPVEYAECGMWVTVLSPAPDQLGTLLAAARHFGWTANCVSAHGSLYRSTNFGQDWYRIDLSREISQVNDIVYDPISPTVLYAAIGNDDGTGGDILKSSDSVTWALPGAWPINGVPFDLEMEPGTHRIFANVNVRLPLYVSEDGGVTWTPTTIAGGDPINDILFTPSAPPVLYDASMQGLYRSTDGAQSWQRAAGVLGHVPVYSLAVVTTTDRVILYAGTTGGVVEGSAARAWRQGDTANSTLVNAGVYRWTTRIRRVYLPLAFRGYTP